MLFNFRGFRLPSEHLVSNESLSPEPGPGWRLPVVCLCPDLAPIISSVLGLTRKFRDNRGGASFYFSQEDYSIINTNGYFVKNVLPKHWLTVWVLFWSWLNPAYDDWNISSLDVGDNRLMTHTSSSQLSLVTLLLSSFSLANLVGSRALWLAVTRTDC